MLTKDSRKVLNILNKLTLGTYIKLWIMGLRCGRNSTQEIQYQYDGTSEGTQSKLVARADLMKKFYKNKTTFTLEKYVTKLKGGFNVLDKYDFPIYYEQMEDNLLEQITSPNIDLKTEVNICRSSHSSEFFNSSMHVSTVVEILYPSTNSSLGRFRKRGIYATRRCDRSSIRGGCFNYQVRGRGPVGRV